MATHSLVLSAGNGFVYGHAADVQALNTMVAEIERADIPCY
jgi:hypothetical protein